MPKINLRELINEKKRHLSWVTRLIRHPTRKRNISSFASKFRPIFIKGTNNTFVVDILPIDSRAGLSLAISTVNKKSKESESIMRVHLSAHEKDTLAITAVQGVFGKRREIYEFENLSKKSAESYLVDIVKEHAKKLGFKKIRFIDYRSIKSFSNPFVRPQVNKQIVASNKAADSQIKKELAKKPSQRKKVKGKELDIPDLLRSTQEKTKNRIRKIYSTLYEEHFKGSKEVDFLGQTFYEKDL